MMNAYICKTCGKQHEGPPLSYGVDAPNLWYEIPENERNERTLLSSDQREIDNQYFFIVGNVEIPIIGANETFSWSVWISLSDVNYRRVCELWNETGRETEKPYFGWLSAHLPVYPETLNLKTLVHTRPIGQRPSVELEQTDHPLAIEQKNGIPWERIQEIAEIILHQ
jgi:hypothetical protein